MKRKDTIPWDDDSFNPHFRPKLVAIRDKIRTMPTVRKDDKARYFLISSLLWDIRGNGALLAQVIWTSISFWKGHSDHRFVVTDPQVQVEVITTPPGGPAIVVEGIEGYFVWTGTNPLSAPPSLDQIAEILKLETAPKIPTTEDEPKKFELTADQKQAIERLMFNHHWRHDQGKCACGRVYQFPEEWAKHARIRVQRYMENDFASD